VDDSPDSQLPTERPGPRASGFGVWVVPAELARAHVGAHARLEPSAALRFARFSDSPAALAVSLNFSPIGFRGGRSGRRLDGGAVVDVGDAGAEVDLVGADPEVLVDRGIDEDLGLGLGFAFVAFSTRSISKKKSMFAPSASTNNKLY